MSTPNRADNNAPYRFYFDDILARQVQEYLFQDLDGKLG